MNGSSNTKENFNIYVDKDFIFSSFDKSILIIVVKKCHNVLVAHIICTEEKHSLRTSCIERVSKPDTTPCNTHGGSND